MRTQRWIIWIALWMALFAHTFVHAANPDTINTVPSAGATFLPTLQTFLKEEDADRYSELFDNVVVSGGTHSTVLSLTATPAVLIAYPGGLRTTETGSVTYTANKTCWTIVHRATTGNLANFTRSAGTHYLVDCTSGSKPSLPTESAWLMEVTTNGSAVTAVTDLRSRNSVVPTYKLAELNTTRVRGKLAIVTDVDSGTLYIDSGVAWRPVLLNPMTTLGDLIYGAASGVPARLAIGAANTVLGVNNAGTGHEYKAVTAGAGISVVHSPNTVTISQTVFPPTGSLTMYVGTVAPTGWTLCDGSAKNATTFEALFDTQIANIAVWGRGTATGTFTCDASTDICTLNNHGFSDAAVIHVLNAGGALPTGLSTATKYYIRDATTNTFKLTTTSGGVAIDITGAGSGTQTIYGSFLVPDFRGRTALGMGSGSGLTARTIGATGGEEAHALTSTENGTHTHTITDPGHTHVEKINGSNAFQAVSGGVNHHIQENFSNDSDGSTPEVTASNTTGITNQNSGSGTGHNVMDPYLVITFIIKTKGHLWLPPSLPLTAALL